MSEAEGRESRMRLALRRQRGKDLAGPWLAEVGAAIGRQVEAADLLPLDLSDSRFESYAQAFRRCRSGEEASVRARAAAAASGEIFAAVQALGRRLASAPVVLFGRHWESVGGLRLDAGSALGAAERLLRVEVDDLRIASLDSADGLLIDHLDREREIEIWVWGERWRAAMGEPVV